MGSEGPVLWGSAAVSLSTAFHPDRPGKGAWAGVLWVSAWVIYASKYACVASSELLNFPFLHRNLTSF